MGTKKGQVRKTARRAYKKRKGKLLGRTASRKSAIASSKKSKKRYVRRGKGVFGVTPAFPQGKIYYDWGIWER